MPGTPLATRLIAPARRRRLSADARRRQMVEDAARHFAAHGFAASTRDLAAAMGCTQALIYRYFPSKRALIDAVFEATFVAAWDETWSALLADRSRPLAERLTAFYTAYLGRLPGEATRLFMRAALDGMGYPDRYTAALDAHILAPIVAELRHEAGLPARSQLDEAERELAMVLHSGLVFLNIRRHIYGTKLPDDLEPLVRLHVATFLDGARAALKRAR